MQGRRFNRQTLTIGAVALIVLIAGALVLGGTDLFGTAGEQPTEEPPEVAQQPPTEQPSDDAGPAPAATEEPPGDQPPVEEPPPPPAQPPEDQPPPTEQPPVVEPPPPATEPPPVVEPPPPATEEPPVGDQPPADEKPPATEDVPLASTEEATEAPVEEPTAEPTEAPTEEPAEEPTAEPTEVATEEVTAEPTEEATEEPTAEPTEEPTEEPAALQAEADVMEPFALVDPEPVGGNPTCGSLGLPDGVTFDPPNPVSGYNAGPGTISWSFSAGAYQVNWSSTFGISAVIMKGGQVGANVYRYDPPALGDSGLITANNPSGQPADLSHLVFCYDEARVPQAAGGLDVTKVVDWNGVPVDGTQTFEICITGPSYPDGDCQSVGANGGTVSWPGLDAGDYTVTETDPGAVWTVSGSGVSVAIADDQTASATITNTHDPLPPPLDAYQIFISKAWLDASMNSTDAPALSGDFAITATSSIGQATCTWSGGSLGCSYTNQIPPALNNDGLWVPAGESYTVSEAGLPAGWYGISGVGTFPATWGSCDGTTCLHTVQNQSSAGGRVVVTKTVDWNGTTPDPTQTFEFCIFGPSFVSPPYNCQTVGPNGGTVSWADLMPGQYDVVESTLDPIWVVGPTRIQKATIIDVNTVELAYTNTYGSPSGPSLSVEGTCDMATGQVTFTLTNNGSAMSAGVPYTISNADGTIASGTTDALGAGASQTFLPPIQTGGGTMTFETTGTGGLYAYAEVDDCFAPGDPRGRVEVTKVVDWNGFTPDPSQTFEFCIFGPSFVDPPYNCQTVGANGGTVAWDNLLPGEYDIVESTLGTVWVVSPDRIQKAFVVGGDVIQLEYTNRYNPPNLVAEGTCDTATGQVTFTLTNTGSAMSDGVPYTIINDNGTIASGTTDALGAGGTQTFTVPVQVDGGTIVFATTGPEGLSTSAEVDDCLAPVNLDVSGTCDTATGQVTFTLTNTGQAMSAGVPYTITNDNGTIASGTTDALGPNESQTFTVPVQVDGGTIVFETTGTGGLYASAEIDDCLAPVNLDVSGTCDTATGQVTFTLTNTGQAMSAGVPYTISNDNGTIMSGTTDALAPNGSQIFLVPLQVDGGTVVFETTGTGGLYAYAEVDDCLAPVNLVAEGECDVATGQVTFTLTNLGQAMSSGVQYTIYTDNRDLQSGITDALGPNETQQFVVDARPNGATIYFMANGMLVPAETTDCFALDKVIFDAECTVDAVATFTITNNGGPMSQTAPYEIVNEDGDVVGSGSYQLGAGQSTSATVSGYYGEIRFNQPGAKTVTTYCAPPPPPPPPPPPTQTEEPEEPEATEEPPGPQGPVAVAQAVCGETTETGLNGFPVIGMNPEDCVDEPLPAPEWEPLEIGEAVCPDWFVYHTNMTGDWEVFRLGELLNNPGAEPNLTQGVGPRVYDVAPSRSPDAEWITFASNRDGNWEIYIGRADGSEQRRVTYNTTAIDIDPMWSPDGNWIVYDSARDGNWELYMINVGTGVEVRLTDDPGNDLNAFWAPDGTKLVFQSDRDGLWQVYELEIATLEVTRLSDGEGDDHDPQYSFDGEQVAFRSYRNGENSVIYKMDADGANVEAVSDLTADATNHAWSDDDSLIAYQSDLDGDLDIYVFEVETGETRLVTDNDIPDYAPTWWCQSPVLIFTSDITGDANIFDTPALPMDADPIDVLREASQLTTDEESDQFPENTPSEENASRQRSLPSPAKNR